MKQLDGKEQHVPVLDGIRGLAILLVLLHHGFGVFTVHTQLETVFKLAIARYGWMGVDLFFVLSGYLISGILLDTRNSPSYFKSFYMRRVLRIFPLYYGTVIICFLVLPYFGGWAAAVFGNKQAELPWFLSYLMNYHTGLTDALGHFWSLCIEEQFYLVWPLMVWLLSRRTLMVFCVVVVAATPVLRVVLWQCGVEVHALHVYAFTRVDALLWGAFLAACAREYGGLDRFRRPALLSLGLASAMMAALYCLTRGFDTNDWVLTNTIGLTVVGFFFASLLVVVVTAPAESHAARLFGGRVLRWLGKYSYAIYVFNWPLVVFMKQRFTDVEDRLPLVAGSQLPSVILFGLVTIGLTCGLAWASYHLLEKHFLKLKRFFPAERVAKSA